MEQAMERKNDYLIQRLQPVSDILPDISKGDFTKRLDIPPEKDEFTEIYIGINFLLDDLHEQIEERKWTEVALKETHEKLERTMQDLKRSDADLQENSETPWWANMGGIRARQGLNLLLYDRGDGKGGNRR